MLKQRENADVDELEAVVFLVDALQQTSLKTANTRTYLERRLFFKRISLITFPSYPDCLEVANLTCVVD